MGGIGKVDRAIALQVALKVKKALKPLGRVEITGSLRRRKALIGDIDIIGNNPEMMATFLTLGQRIRGKPDGVKSSVIVDGIQVDFRIFKNESWGTGKMMTTGSAEENIYLRATAKQKGFTKLNDETIGDKYV